jgi:hypothetical protein
MGQQTRTGQATINRATRSARLRDRVASGAGKLGAHMTDDFEAARLVLKNFRDILANLAQTRAACAACAAGAVRGISVNDIFTRQVIGQLA